MGTSRMLRWVAACTVASCVVLGACDSTIDDEMSGATGSLRLLVTDKPYPVEFIESAVVTIERIEVRMADVESDDDDGGDDATLGEDGDGDGTLEGDGDDDGPDDDGDDGDSGDDSDDDDADVDDDSDDADDDADDSDDVDDDDADSDDDDDVTDGGAGETAPATAGDDGEGDDSDDDGTDDDSDDADAADADGDEDDDGDDGADVDDDSDDDAVGDEDGGDDADDDDADDDDAGDDDDADDDDENGDDDNDVTSASGDGDDDSPFIVIFEGERSFNLLDLQNGRTDLLADVEIPAGTYDQMRVFVSGGEVTLVGGEVFALKVPSGAQSGIKLHFDFEIVDGETTSLLLDIDLSRIFNVIPGGKIDNPDEISGFHFRPSIAMRLINVVDAGAIAGTVTGADEAPLAGVFVVAFADAEEVGGAITEEDGGYMVSGLPTGTYRLEYSLDGYEDAEVTEVSVTAGATTENVDVTMTAEPEGADAG